MYIIAIRQDAPFLLRTIAMRFTIVLIYEETEVFMRLDKLLCEMNIGSRSMVKDYVRQGLVTVNGETINSPQQKVDEHGDVITFQGRTLRYQKHLYYMLNKPKGVVSATRDNTAETVVDLVDSTRSRELFPIGRLDKDTEGLLLITNDGELSHRLLSPKRHVEKTYLVGLRSTLTAQDIERLETGVDIGDEKPTRPGRVTVVDAYTIHLTICEGRYHQVKRMLLAVGNEVLSLKRIRFGGLALDEKLAPGESRELTDEEVIRLHEA